jgi:hypothetical protein
MARLVREPVYERATVIEPGSQVGTSSEDTVLSGSAMVLALLVILGGPAGPRY